MLKVYGTWLCPDCRNVEQKLNAAGIEFEFVDVFNSTANMKEFLQIRDNNSAFETAKANASIGIPAFVKEDGTITCNEEEVLAQA